VGASRRRPRGCRGLLPWPLAQEQLGSSRNWQFPLTSPDRAHRRRRLAKVACSANARLLLFLQAAASDARMGCGRRCRGARARARAPQKSPREYATAGWGLRGCAVGPSAPGNFRPIRVCFSSVRTGEIDATHGGNEEDTFASFSRGGMSSSCTGASAHRNHMMVWTSKFEWLSCLTCHFTCVVLTCLTCRPFCGCDHLV
jgi:hypothetical protein